MQRFSNCSLLFGMFSGNFPPQYCSAVVALTPDCLSVIRVVRAQYNNTATCSMQSQNKLFTIFVLPFFKNKCWPSQDTFC